MKFLLSLLLVLNSGVLMAQAPRDDTFGGMMAEPFPMSAQRSKMEFTAGQKLLLKHLSDLHVKIISTEDKRLLGIIKMSDLLQSKEREELLTKFAESLTAPQVSILLKRSEMNCRINYLVNLGPGKRSYQQTEELRSIILKLSNYEVDYFNEWAYGAYLRTGQFKLRDLLLDVWNESRLLPICH